MTNAIIVSASSDIGLALGHKWLKQGWNVYGTYRTDSPDVQKLKASGATLVQCDLGNIDSIREACATLRSVCKEWDVLVMAPGAQEPVGPFLKTKFDEWEKSIQVNFTSQMRMTYELMDNRCKKKEPCVVYFAGGGTNGAVINYSAYTISKIALIKMCELMDAEIPDTRFTILGPGWVKTKIHDATLKAGESMAGSNFKKTQEKLASDECTPMEDVLAFFDWVIGASRAATSGRNFSVVFDNWRAPDFNATLEADPNLCKLRRFGNDRVAANSKLSKQGPGSSLSALREDGDGILSIVDAGDARVSSTTGVEIKPGSGVNKALGDYQKLGYCLLDAYSREDESKIERFGKSWVYKLLAPWITQDEVKFPIEGYHLWSKQLPEEHRKVFGASNRHQKLDRDLLSVVLNQQVVQFLAGLGVKRFRLWDEGLGNVAFRLVRPGVGDGYPFCAKDWGLAKNVISFWIPIVGRSSNETLLVAPGSHLKDHPKVMQNDQFAREPRYSGNLKDLGAIRPNLNRGEIICYDSRTLHSEETTPNGTTRLSLEVRVSPV